MKISNTIKFAALAIIAGVALTGCAAHATKVVVAPPMKDRVYEVTITNITHGMEVTPMIVASHNFKYKMFKLGEPASDELQHLAEAGHLMQMEAAMMASGNVHDIVQTPAGLLAPGKSVTVQIKTNMRMSFITLGGMLLSTNDGFVAINGTDTHHIRHGKTVYSVVYDSGTEINSERCRDIPGSVAECHGDGEGYNPKADIEGFVHVHQGLHRIGDLHDKHQDWRNPAIKVEIHRVK